jgi:hypothetical protein
MVATELSRKDYELRLLALSVAYESNQPVLIWGMPGEGKSSAIEKFARDRQIHAEIVVTSLREPTDLNGLPVVGSDGVVRFAPPQWLTATNAAENSLVVFDEITTAPPATRAAALRVVNERVSADTALNQTTRIVAIANPPDVAEDGWELGAPMSNRFFHIRDWSLPVDVLAVGLSTGRWPSVPVLEVDEADRVRRRADVAAAISGFLRGDPSMRSRLPAHPDERQYPWPSPRSWTMCAELLACVRSGTLDGEALPGDLMTMIVEGCVGPIAAPTFLAFLQALDLPDPEKLLAAPEDWQVPARGDLTWAVLSRLTSYLISQGKDAGKDRWLAAGKVIAHAASGQGDVAVAAAHDWWEHARSFGPTVMPAELAAGRFSNVFKLTRE